MKAVIMQFAFGILAFNEENQVLGKAVFPKKPERAANVIFKLNEGELPTNLQPVISTLQNQGYDTFLFDNSQLANAVKKAFNISVEVADQTAQVVELRSKMEKVAVETGFAKDAAELNMWIRSISLELTKLQVRGTTAKRDLIAAQAIQTLDDLDRTLNLFMSRLREWFGVHFPELDRLIEKHETYARLVLNLGSKDNFSSENLKREDLPEAKAEQIGKVAASSMGAEISEEDLTQIQAVSKQILELYKLRQNMENYLDKTMQEIAPNTKAIAGSLLGARLIAVAGGLENLARRPASTLQVLGAEKALFRSLKTGARPPKHGLIFQHTLLHDAKRWQRGKIARAIAGKLAIAIRTDAYHGKFVGDWLKAALDKRIEEIKQKYPEPPPLKEQKLRPTQEQPSREFRGEKRPFRPGKGREFGGRRSGRREERMWRKKRRANKS